MPAMQGSMKQQRRSGFGNTNSPDFWRDALPQLGASRCAARGETACDLRGRRRALRRGGRFAPDCYVGDGDSGGTAVAGAENILLRPEKDESDLQAAYTMARAHGCTRLYLTACTGGRLDHALANRSCWKRLALMVSRPSCSTPIIA